MESSDCKEIIRIIVSSSNTHNCVHSDSTKRLLSIFNIKNVTILNCELIIDSYLSREIKKAPLYFGLYGITVRDGKWVCYNGKTLKYIYHD